MINLEWYHFLQKTVLKKCKEIALDNTICTNAYINILANSYCNYVKMIT